MRSLHWREALVRAMAVLLLASAMACGGGDGGDGGDGDGNDQGAFNFNEANMKYAAGVASRATDAFAPLSDALDAALSRLWGAAATDAGQQRVLALCASGSASLTWNDVDGNRAVSSGDSGVVALARCRVHPGDGEVLDGTITASFTNVSSGPPRQATVRVQIDLATQDGTPGTLRGTMHVSASSPDGLLHTLIFKPAAGALFSATGDVAFDLGCFEVYNGYNPAPGFQRWIAIDGSVRTLDRIMSFSPGARLRFRDDDRPGGEDKVVLLSFMNQPVCPALGVTGGVGDSDGSTLEIAAGAGAGEMRLALHRAGAQPATVSCSWWELLHPDRPATGSINSTNAVQVAGVAVASLALPRDVGTLATDLTLAAFRGVPVALCSAGRYAVSPTPTLAAGETVTISFIECQTAVLGDPVTLAGSAVVRVEAVSGAPATDAYTLATALGPLDVTVRDALGTSRVTGEFRFSRTAAGETVTERSESMAGSALVLAEAAGSAASERRMSAFSLTAGATPDGTAVFSSAGDAATLRSALVAGDLAVRTATVVSGPRERAPERGAITVTAADGTSVTLTMSAGGAVAVALDDDGDGATDATIAALWDDLR